VAERGRGQTGELAELVVGYAKQETLGPLRGVGRFVLFGLLGSSLLALGLSVLALAALRALQSETGAVFAGDRSWAPYLIVAAGSLVVAGAAAWRVTRGPARR
jgi:hypothetical protein